jgi:hypothetical protein
MMVGPVEPPRHRTVTALRSSQLSLSFSAHCGLSPPLSDAAVRPVEADIRAERSILSAGISIWSCPAYVPVSQLIYAAFRSNAKGLLPPSDEWRRRGL